MNDQTTPWRKAIKSGGNGGDCIELRLNGGVVQIRDSKNPDGPVLNYTKRELAAFIDGASNGEFDDLAV